MQGGNTLNIYGGNNEGGTTQTSNITVSGGTSGNVFGGGNKANTTTSNVTVNNGKSQMYMVAQTKLMLQLLMSSSQVEI